MNIITAMRRNNLSLKKSRKRSIPFTSMRFVLAFGAILLSPFAALVPTASAGAYTCPASALCVYQDTHGNGPMTYFGGWRNTCLNVIPSWNDRISSIDNNMSIKVAFYDNANCGASASAWWFTVPAGYQATSGDSIFSWWMNDEISSMYFY